MNARTLLPGLDGHTDWTLADDHGHPIDGLITAPGDAPAATAALERIGYAAAAAHIPVLTLTYDPTPVTGRLTMAHDVAETCAAVFGPNPRALILISGIDRIARRGGASTARRLHDLVDHPGRAAGIIATTDHPRSAFIRLGANQSARTHTPAAA